MVEVRLLYPAEKMEAAARLADSLESAGYQVERKALANPHAFPDIGAESRGAAALLLIWSRGLVSAAMAEGALGEARRRPNLIEVSVDGIEPAVGAEVSPVVLLSGWRGQPFHLGWQRILADIKRLCGARDDAGRKAREPKVAAPGPAGAARTPKPGRRTARAALAAGALVAAALGTAAILDRGAPIASRPVEPRASVAVASASPAVASAGRQDVPSAEVPPTIADSAVGGSFAAAAPAASGPEPRPSAEPAAPRPAAAPRSSPPRRVASTSAPEVKRYSRKHSKTMRLFCQRSGRSTPQCRSFARSMRALRG